MQTRLDSIFQYDISRKRRSPSDPGGRAVWGYLSYFFHRGRNPAFHSYSPLDLGFLTMDMMMLLMLMMRWILNLGGRFPVIYSIHPACRTDFWLVTDYRICRISHARKDRSWDIGSLPLWKLWWGVLYKDFWSGEDFLAVQRGVDYYSELDASLETQESGPLS